MNDNWTHGWKNELRGVAFRATGILLFAGGIIGGIFGPATVLQLLFVLMGLAGFAMVMV